jgi:putative transposase
VTGQLKGAASYEINRSFELDTPFRWQESYGVFTFGERALSDVLDYIARQKEHHLQGTIIPYFERIED